MFVTIKEAIEEVTTMKRVCKGLFPPKGQAALSLGIEAMAYIERSRAFGEYPVNRQLPGETRVVRRVRG